MKARKNFQIWTIWTTNFTHDVSVVSSSGSVNKHSKSAAFRRPQGRNGIILRFPLKTVHFRFPARPRYTVYKCRNSWHEIRSELRGIANIREIS
ncbi:hypothetical protein PUN28_010554 [Cardiocondyla obscurior]|uniref:Uncharacterized protein n=1 Tax=Cardiocondyla obscurior TaxID=286306 RepID=A0AAW2FJ57_9HYME